MHAPVVLHGRLLHRFRLSQVEPWAHAQYARIVEASPLMCDLGRRVDAILDANASNRSKFGKLLALGNQIGAAIAPHAGCQRRCAACCHIAVTLSGAEAERIGARIGVTPAAVPKHQDPDDLTARFFGAPCPFLHEHECTIYEDRPAACRLHFTLDTDSYFCQTSISPEDSAVPNVDLHQFWLGYGLLGAQLHPSIGDIRQYFPAVSGAVPPAPPNRVDHPANAS